MLLDELGISLEGLQQLPALVPDELDPELCSASCGVSCLSVSCTGTTCGVTCVQTSSS